MNKQVLVCQYLNCRANDAAEVLAAFLSDPAAEIIATECQGQCNMGATVRVLPDQVWYCRVKPEDVPEIIQSHLRQGQPVRRLLHPRLN
jgi:(2Fe-2S) ferredoxin